MKLRQEAAPLNLLFQPADRSDNEVHIDRSGETHVLPKRIAQYRRAHGRRPGRTRARPIDSRSGMKRSRHHRHAQMHLKKSSIVPHSFGRREHRHPQGLPGLFHEMMIRGDGRANTSREMPHIDLQQLDITLIRNVPAFGS